MPEDTKRPRGRPKNEPLVGPAEIVEAAQSSGGRAGLQKATGISQKDAMIVKRLTGLTEEEFRERHHAKLRGVLDELLEKIGKEVDRLTPAQKAISFGILSDKLNMSPKSVTNALHIHLKGGERNGILQSLLGSDGKRTVFKQTKGEPTRATTHPPSAESPAIDV